MNIRRAVKRLIAHLHRVEDDDTRQALGRLLANERAYLESLDARRDEGSDAWISNYNETAARVEHLEQQIRKLD